MRLVIILSILVLTSGTYYSAVNSLPGTLAQEALSSDEMRALQASVADLEVAGRDNIAQLEKAIADHDKLSAANAALTDTLATTAAQNAELTTQSAAAAMTVAALNEKHAASIATIAELTAAQEPLEEKIALLETQKGAEAAAADAKFTALGDMISTEQSRVRALEGELLRAKGTAQMLSEQIANAAPATASQATEAEYAALTAELEQANSALQTAEARIVTLEAKAAEPTPALATLTEDGAITEDEITGLQQQIAALTTQVEERDAQLASLDGIATPEDNEVMTLASCNEQTSAIFAQEQITFDRGTTAIAEVTMPSLENLASKAQLCVDAGFMIEIAGHTDSRGGDEDNLDLSERRALAVYDFLFSGGVPSAAMRAVGYGESQPIADNDTDEGRALNRRIDIVWLQP